MYSGAQKQFQRGRNTLYGSTMFATVVSESERVITFINACRGSGTYVGTQEREWGLDKRF